MEKLGDILKRQNPKEVSAKVSGKLSPDPGEEICEICGGFGNVHPLKEDGKPDYQRTVPCLCVKDKLEREKAGRMLKYCGLPADSEHMTFKNFKVDSVTKEAFEAAKNVAEEKGLKWLTLLGKVDQGKTHLAIAICRHWLESGKPARYAYVPLLLDELREGYGREGDFSYQSKLHFFLNVPLLVLDDLGVEKPTDFAREKLNTIIDYRYNQGLALVVTMNIPIDKIPGDETHRIASRLQRFRAGKVVALEGQEYRLRHG